MNYKKIFVAATALLLITPKSDWQKKLDNYCAAMRRKDLKACTAIIKDNFSPDFKYIPLKGKTIGLDEWLAEGKMEMQVTEKVTMMSYKINSVKQGKDSAVMKTTLKFEGMVKMDPKAKAGIMTGNSSSDQKMVKKDGKWWIVEIKETSGKATYNGKPMNM
jgi:hypothetical protein